MAVDLNDQASLVAEVESDDLPGFYHVGDSGDALAGEAEGSGYGSGTGGGGYGSGSGTGCTNPSTVTINPVGPVDEQKYDSAAQQLQLSGTATNAWSVNVYVDNVFIGSASVNGGLWTWYWLWTDDNPSGTPSDDLTIEVVANAYPCTASASTTLTINNVDPVVRIQAVTAAWEGTDAAFTFTIQDDGPDSFDLAIDWGDGSSESVAVPAQGSAPLTSVTLNHAYRQDGVYTITATATDDDTGTDSTTGTVSVANLPPTADAGPDQSSYEGDTVTLSGSVTDPGLLDTHTFLWEVSANNGQIIPNGTGQTFGFIPDDEGVYTVTFTATDDYGDSDSDEALVYVSNVAPTITSLSLSPDPVFEGDSLTLSGALFDPGTADIETVTIDWGDGATSTVTTTGGNSQIPAVTHVFIDDGPSPGNGTPSDVQPINVTVSDGDGGFAYGSIDVTVNNLPPAITFDPPQATYYEGSDAYLTGTITDPGVGDLHTVDIDWGDGQTSTHNLGPGPFSIPHIYYDDSVGWPVTVTVTDDDTGSWSGGTSLPVENVAPSVSLDALPAIDEGEQLTITGQVSDPGIYDDVTVTFEIDLNFDGDTLGPGETVSITVPATGDLVRYFTHTTAVVPDDGGAFDGAGNRIWGNGTSSDLLPVNVTGDDGDGGISAFCTSGATVNNVAPEFEDEDLLDVEFEFDENGNLVSATVSGPFTDPGSLDFHRIAVAWADGGTGDGTVNPVDLAFGDRTFSVKRLFDPLDQIDPADLYPIQLQVEDDDLGQTSFVTIEKPRANMNIYNGGPVPKLVPEEDEETVGAFTVLNRNDSDSDGRPDNEEGPDPTDPKAGVKPWPYFDPVTNTTKFRGRPEGDVDLIKIELPRPPKYDGGDVALKVFPTNMKLWSSPKKVDVPYELDADGVVTFEFGQFTGDTFVVWAELTAEAPLRWYRFEYSYKNYTPDVAYATGVWAEFLQSTYFQTPLPDALPWNALSPDDAVIKNAVQPLGGTGHRPPIQNEGIRAVILFAWKIQPAGVENYDFVKWGVARQRNSEIIIYGPNLPLGGERVPWPGTKVSGDWPSTEFPREDELPNDDGVVRDFRGPDETFKKEQRLLFSVDAPGIFETAPGPGIVRDTTYVEFDEFVRVTFDGTEPQGDAMLGSRASPKTTWYNKLSLRRAANGDWERDPDHPNVIWVKDKIPNVYQS